MSNSERRGSHHSLPHSPKVLPSLPGPEETAEEAFNCVKSLRPSYTGLYPQISRLLPDSQGQSLACTVLYVPYSHGLDCLICAIFSILDCLICAIVPYERRAPLLAALAHGPAVVAHNRRVPEVAVHLVQAFGFRCHGRSSPSSPPTLTTGVRHSYETLPP